jgi:hypothetical protein
MLGIGAAVDLDVDQRLEAALGLVASAGHAQQPVFAVAAHLHHRVHDQVHRQALAIDLHRDRVDQERHVVVDDLDHGVRRLPAVFVQPRVVDAQLGCTAGEAAREVPVRQRRTVQVGQRALGQVFGGHLAVVLARELGRLGSLLGRQLGTHELGDLLDQRFGAQRPRLGVERLHRHGGHRKPPFRTRRCR